MAHRDRRLGRLVCLYLASRAREEAQKKGRALNESETYVRGGWTRSRMCVSDSVGASNKVINIKLRTGGKPSLVGN